MAHNENTLREEMKNPDNVYLIGDQTYYSSNCGNVPDEDRITDILMDCGATSVFTQLFESSKHNTFHGVFNDYIISVHTDRNKNSISTTHAIDINKSGKDEFERVSIECGRKQYEINDRLYSAFYGRCE